MYVYIYIYILYIYIYIYSNYNKRNSGPGLCKFNNSVISDENCTEKLRNFIKNMKDTWKNI